jgi:hypothetical protein
MFYQIFFYQYHLTFLLLNFLMSMKVIQLIFDCIILLYLRSVYGILFVILHENMFILISWNPLMYDLYVFQCIHYNCKPHDRIYTCHCNKMIRFSRDWLCFFIMNPSATSIMNSFIYNITEDIVSKKEISTILNYPILSILTTIFLAYIFDTSREWKYFLKFFI